ncbi:MAG TPA: tetratricopeptide repeat protein [Gemmatimonadaceae bacterium]|nr:tetratricopeptide repeat protein [Gemmatimonadaceae bacterium]
MTDPARRSALAALDTARPAIARLDATRHPEELAADLIESWSAVETALRSLLGGSSAGGQALIREARQRQLLTFEQANALAEFGAAAERAHRTDYQPTAADLGAARDGFLKLESGLMTAPSGVPATAVPDLVSTEGMRSTPLGVPERVPPPRDGLSGRVKIAIAVVAVLVIVALVLGGRQLGWFGGGSTALQRGISDYAAGQREAAAGEFAKAERDDPNDPLPHVYLSRMARDVGNMTVAGEEAQRAVQLGPTNAIALREMGLYLLSAQNYELARRFLVRAVQANTDDHMAMGYLACALYRMGRVTEAQTWMTHAGPGAWSACMTGAPGVPAQPMPGQPGTQIPPA